MAKTKSKKQSNHLNKAEKKKNEFKIDYSKIKTLKDRTYIMISNTAVELKMKNIEVCLALIQLLEQEEVF